MFSRIALIGFIALIISVQAKAACYGYDCGDGAPQIDVPQNTFGVQQPDLTPQIPEPMQPRPQEPTSCTYLRDNNGRIYAVNCY